MADTLVEQLLAEVQQLRAEVAALKGGTTAELAQAEAPAEPFSRRHLLTKLGAAAAGAGAVAVLGSTEQAAAATGGNMILGAINTAADPTVLRWDGAKTNSGMLFLADDSGTSPAFAFYPAALGGWTTGATLGVANGVYGFTTVAGGNAVVGWANGPSTTTGVLGRSSEGDGVTGTSDGELGTAAVRAEANFDGAAVRASATNGYAVEATTFGPIAIKSTAQIAVRATTNGVDGTAVWGDAPGLSGVGVLGEALGGGVGIIGRAGSDASSGSKAAGFENLGAGANVVATTFAATNVEPAVLGVTQGIGSGVRGDVNNASSPAAAVFGVTNGTGSGVSGKVVVTTASGAGMFGATAGTGNAIRGRVTNTSNTAACGRFNHDGGGIGVQGTSATGVGASFQGAAAALRLVPKAGAGAPTTGAHLVGELVVDAAGAMYLCTASGTPGTWKSVTLS